MCVESGAQALGAGGLQMLAGGIGTSYRDNSRGQHSIYPDPRPARRLPHSVSASPEPPTPIEMK